jgi:hypothetical protein
MAILAMEGALTKTAAYTPAGSAGTAIASSSLIDARIHIEVTDLSAASGTPSANIVFQDTVDDFTAVQTGPSLHLKGTIGGDAETWFRKSWPVRDFPNLRFGVTSAELRCKIEALGGTTPSITYRTWIEYNG